MKFVGTNHLASVTGSSTPIMVGPLGIAHVAPAESVRSRCFPALYQEDTPFSTQVRMPIADLWRGRLQLDAFYREISADSVFRGLPQSSSIWWTAPGSLMLRPAASYGIHLSFRMPHIRTGTLCHYLVGGHG